MESVTFGGTSIPYILPRTFFGCDALTDVILPEGISYIGAAAFGDCKGLKSILIPKSVTEVRDMAFYRCPLLERTYYAGSEAEWKNVTVAADNDLLTKSVYFYSKTFPGYLDSPYWFYNNDKPTLWG